MKRVVLAAVLMLLLAAAVVAAGSPPSKGSGDGEPVGADVASEEEYTGGLWPAYVFTDSVEIWELARKYGPVKPIPLGGSFLAFIPETVLHAIEQGDDVRAVAGVGVFPGGRPPAGYQFTHAKRYWPVFVSTASESARQLIAERALAEPGFGPPDINPDEAGFVAWLPEPLVPVLEADPEVGLDWDGPKVPAGTIA